MERIKLFKSSEIVPLFTFGISPLGPKILLTFLNNGSISGVAKTLSNCSTFKVPFAISSISFASPALAAPFLSASAALVSSLVRHKILVSFNGFGNLTAPCRGATPRSFKIGVWIVIEASLTGLPTSVALRYLSASLMLMNNGEVLAGFFACNFFSASLRSCLFSSAFFASISFLFFGANRGWTLEKDLHRNRLFVDTAGIRRKDNIV